MSQWDVKMQIHFSLNSGNMEENNCLIEEETDVTEAAEQMLMCIKSVMSALHVASAVKLHLYLPDC